MYSIGSTFLSCSNSASRATVALSGLQHRSKRFLKLYWIATVELPGASVSLFQLWNKCWINLVESVEYQWQDHSWYLGGDIPSFTPRGSYGLETLGSRFDCRNLFSAVEMIGAAEYPLGHLISTSPVLDHLVLFLRPMYQHWSLPRETVHYPHKLFLLLFWRD